MIDDPTERLLWGVLGRVEADTLRRYAAHVPALVTAEKRALLARLRAAAPDDQGLDASPLAGPVAAVLAAAASETAEAVLFVQGLVLELLGRTIYVAAERARDVGAASRAIACDGATACARVAAAAAAEAAARVGRGPAAFEAFADRSHAVLGALDALAEPVDRTFGARIDRSFAVLMGEFTADLLHACMDLDMERRRVVAHLASAAMGL